MPRLDISVAYKDKDEAKDLGARWDATGQIWYVPDGVDPAPFREWFISPPPSFMNIRSSGFIVATQKASCIKCSSSTREAILVLPSGWADWDVIEDDGESAPVMAWCRRLVPAIPHYIMTLSEPALQLVQSVVPRYKLGLINGQKCRKFFNHCGACGALQEEVKRIYNAETAKYVDGIELHQFDQPFECSSNFQSDMMERRIDTWECRDPSQFPNED